ncbi:sugar phosphate isomerase/epimerase [Lichenibacterium minor]|uniref:Sugar phosphate isomerase/epimerase n=1 Tax=Lichenibacterium minor TaxID=2316528 RepID=A0A4Q2U0R4_9HYPH|nr:sugar phosphate isomerase/epimerase [Lichenibacterium minor]RYC29238.1 sugar phosphate isomerase/epimerase [Lichenibacterium minor]
MAFKFKYAFNTWCYSSFPVWVPSYTLDEAIKRIARAGYDGIEIGCAAPHAWPAHLDRQRRVDIRSLLADHNLDAVSLLPAPGGGPGNNITSPMREERVATIAHYKEVIDLAHDLGAGKVLYIAGWRVFGTPYQQAWDWTLAALRELGPYAADRGITLCIENTAADSNLVDTAGQALMLRDEVGLDNVQLMFDTYHALYRNEVSSDQVYEIGRHLKHVHFADAGRAPPGEGVVDWVGVLQALKDVDFDGYCTMEIGFARRDAEPDRYARNAIRYLKSIEHQVL